MKKFVAVLLSSIVLMQTGLCFANDVTIASKDYSGQNSNSEQSSNPDALKKCIEKAKTIFNISDDYENFNYGLDDYNEVIKYDLTWEKPKKKDDKDFSFDRININIDENGNIYNYYKYIYEPYDLYPEISKYSKKDCENVAIEFIKKVIPDYASQYELDNISKSEKLGNSYFFSFTRKVNGIKVSFNDIQIEVSANVKEVVSYNIDNPDMLSKPLPDISAVISKDKALEIYNNEHFNDMIYTSYPSMGQNKVKYETFLAYPITETLKTIINANTGEILEPYENIRHTTENAKSSKYEYDMSAGVEAEDTVALSEAEINEIDANKNIKSKEECIKIINNVLPNLEKKATEADIKYTKLYKMDYLEDEEIYLYAIDFGDKYFEIDALTGEIVSFYGYKESISISDISIDSPAPSEETRTKNIETALEFIRKNSPDRETKIELFEDGVNYYTSVNYNRLVNDIKYPQNYMKFEFENGNISSYHSSWNKNTSFPQPLDLVSKDEAFSTLKDNYELELVYCLNGNKVIVPAYEFLYETYGSDIYKSYISNSNRYINAKTNKIVGYNNEAAEDNINDNYELYADINDIKCKDIVEKLYDNGYRIDDKNFNPEKEITIKEFYKFMSKRDRLSNEDKRILEYLGFPKDIEEDDERLNKTITKIQAAKVVARYFAEVEILNSNIFKTDVSDAEKIANSNIGYIAVAMATDIISAEDDGTFSPDKPLTREEAAEIIYNFYMKNVQK